MGRLVLDGWLVILGGLSRMLFNFAAISLLYSFRWISFLFIRRRTISKLFGKVFYENQTNPFILVLLEAKIKTSGNAKTSVLSV